MFNNQSKGIIFAVLAAITYGMNPLFGLPLYAEGMQPPSVLFYRFFFASLLMAGVLFISGKDKFHLPRRYLILTATAGILMALTCLFWFFSFSLMDSGIGASLLFVYPVMVALIMRIFFKEKLSAMTVAGMVTAVAGVAILCSGSSGGKITAAGVVLIMLSALTYAVYLVMVKTTCLRELAPAALTFYAMLFSLPVFLIPLRMGIDLQAIPSCKALLNAAGLALFPSLCSFLFAAVAIHAIGPTGTAVLGALEPVTAVTIGIVVFHEKLSWLNCAGIILILAAVIIVIKGNQQIKNDTVNHDIET